MTIRCETSTTGSKANKLQLIARANGDANIAIVVIGEQQKKRTPPAPAAIGKQADRKATDGGSDDGQWV
jgi:hypothetical protein